MDPAVGVVLGALIGAGGSVVTTLSGARTARAAARAQGEVQQAQWLADHRRSAYVEFLGAASTLHGRWRYLAATLVHGPDDPTAGEALIAENRELLKSLQHALAGVVVVGPGAVADQATTLYENLTAMHDAGADWIDKSRLRDPDAAAAHHRLLANVLAARDTTGFAAAAGAALGRW